MMANYPTACWTIPESGIFDKSAPVRWEGQGDVPDILSWYWSPDKIGVIAEKGAIVTAKGMSHFPGVSLVDGSLVAGVQGQHTELYWQERTTKGGWPHWPSRPWSL